MDGFALPVKKLSAPDLVETLDLSGKNLCIASAVVTAYLIGDNDATARRKKILFKAKVRARGAGKAFGGIRKRSSAP